MSATGNSIFLLEVIARRVMLTDPDEASSTCPLCVCFRFPGLVDMDICEGDFCDDVDGGSRRPVGGEVRMTRGKSCLFAVSAADLCRTARNFCATIAVYRRVAGGPETRLVAQTRMQFGRSFTEVILDPDQEERTRELKRSLALYENGRVKSVGVLEAIVRLTSRGDLLVTQFARATDSRNYQYKGLNEYVPTNACGPDDCLDDDRCCAKKCRENRVKGCGKKFRAKCCGKKIETADGDDVKCEKQMNRVKCILNVMEMMRDLYTKSTQPSLEQNGSSEQATDGFETRPCVFDPNCPVASCPFRSDEPLNAFVNQLINGPARKSAVVAGTAAQDPAEIVDDADLFVVKVGRVDPCRTNEPVYRNKNTQYLLTDVPAELLPAPVPDPVKSKGNKKKTSKKKGKKK